MTKWIIALVVIAVAAAALWWSGMLAQWLPMSQPSPASQTTPTPQAQTEESNDLPTASNDASDAAIQKDVAAIDAQIENYNEDSTAVSSSLSDKPVTQEY